jgi:hypothetical protein
MMRTVPAAADAVPDGADALKVRIRDLLGDSRVPEAIRVVRDTSDFFKVERGDVLLLAGRHYLIRGNEREGRFGLDEEPKLWVKRAIDLANGDVKIIKLSFKESFAVSVGEVTFDLSRSPRKEARVLERVQGHSGFMQGFSVRDSADNVVRIIDFIRGDTLHQRVISLAEDHERYYRESFPEIFRNFHGLVEAIHFLHRAGEKHGDIRRDHILVEKETGLYRWIDFDFNFHSPANPFGYDLFGLGNVLAFLVGGGDQLVGDLKRDRPELYGTLVPGDLNIVFRNRIVNLRKIYPYLPEELNDVLLRFSRASEVYYERTEELLEDLSAVVL